VFAKKVQIVLGEKIVDWAAFSRTVFHLKINQQMYLGNQFSLKPPPVVFYRDRSTNLASGTSSTEMPQSLLEFLRDTRQCESSDPRDKIYALLGMSTEKEESALAPNYALSTWETFLHLTKFLISRDKRLDCLCHVQRSPSSNSRASWVPDWSFQGYCEVLGHKKDLVRPYKASIGLPAEVGFQHDPETLIAKGKVFDTVSKVGPEYQLSTTSLKEWEAMVSASGSSRTVDTSTLFMDILIAYPPYPGPNVYRRFYPAWRRLTFGEGETLDARENAEASIFQEHMNRACKGRSLFVTEKGFVGLGPATNQKGDAVAVLLGGSVPFVLRQEHSWFTLVGECYVHSLMNGEVVQDSTIGFEMLRLI
jgi:hypothetical protein